ncbi:MAG TPA: hypothetical protein DCG24_02480 [Bacteroidetes bacterium]|nr:hypothetical protein [Bacteroidota bacterium]
MKKWSLMLFFLLAGFVTFAQTSKITSAITYLENGELDRALAAIEEATVHEKTAGIAKTWFTRGRIFNAIAADENGKFAGLSENPLDMAMESLNKALTLPDADKYKKQMLVEYSLLQMNYFNMGSGSYGQRDFQGAHDNFRKSADANKKLLEIDPTLPLDTGVIFNIGLTAYRIGNRDEAIDIFQKLVNMKYKEPYVYQALAEMYAEDGKMQEAFDVIATGRKNYPNDEALIITELNFYLSQGKVEEIVDKLNEAIAVDPNNEELYFAKGNAYGELMKTAVIEGGSPSASVKACLGAPDAMEAMEGKHEGAEVWTYGKVKFVIEEGKVYEIEGADKDIKALTGKCNDREKYNAYFSEAVGAYRKAIDINPGNFDNYLNLGALYYNTAIEINKKMINLPLDADKEYAELESRRNELYKEALPYFEKALEIDPENIPTMQALKEIYAKTNNFEKMKEIKAKLGE